MIRAKCIGGPKDGEVVAALHGDKLLVVTPPEFSSLGHGVDIAPNRLRVACRQRHDRPLHLGHALEQTQNHVSPQQLRPRLLDRAWPPASPAGFIDGEKCTVATPRRVRRQGLLGGVGQCRWRCGLLRIRHPHVARDKSRYCLKRGKL